MNKTGFGDDERIRTLEARTATWLRIAVVQQVLLVGMLASAYLSLDAKISTSIAQEDITMSFVKLTKRLDAQSAQIDTLELAHQRRAPRGA